MGQTPKGMRDPCKVFGHSAGGSAISRSGDKPPDLRQIQPWSVSISLVLLCVHRKAAQSYCGEGYTLQCGADPVAR